MGGDENLPATTTHAFLEQSSTGGPRITIDVYMPPGRANKIPLLIFLQGNEPSQADERIFFGGEVGDTMQRRGVAVASIMFDLAAGDSLRACTQGVTGVVAEVMKRLASHTFSRVVLLGRGIGASVAAILALDRRFFDGAGVEPGKIAGVIALRGTYDLSEGGLEGHPDAPFFAAATDNPAQSSAATFARADAPPFLFLSGGDDVGSWARLARSFARALERAGAPNVETYVVPGRDARSVMNWAGEANALGDLVVSFVAVGPTVLPIDSPLGVRQRWGGRRPPLDNDELRADRQRIATYPVDAEIRSTVMVVFDRIPFELSPLAGKTYEAIDLLSYLATLPESEIGSGDFLVTTNIRGEQQYFSREDLERTRPVLVVGLDDEPNLYRVFTQYRLKRAYSWKKGEEPMPTMIRPLGAFLHFRSAPPPHLRNKSYAPFGLTARSFRWVRADPLGAVRGLTGDLREAMLGEQGCLKCHTFRGVGARSHHVLAADGAPYGAFGLPLEEYPVDVLRRFLFEQDAVAESFGVFPLRVAPSAVNALFDLVTHEKK